MFGETDKAAKLKQDVEWLELYMKRDYPLHLRNVRTECCR